MTIKERLQKKYVYLRRIMRYFQSIIHQLFFINSVYNILYIEVTKFLYLLRYYKLFCFLLYIDLLHDYSKILRMLNKIIMSSIKFY